MRRMMMRVLVVVGVVGLWLGPGAPGAAATWCPPDSVRSGTGCIDKYEASVWDLSGVSGFRKHKLVAKIKAGIVTEADLVAAGAVQRGLFREDLRGAGCPDTGNGCKEFYAVSIPGVTPSTFITWFQALAAARNSRKRLPTNAEWQAAALGTPDGAPCNVSGSSLADTGTAGCVSDVGAFDMVGNLSEWVADWVPRSAACPGSWGAFSDDFMCLVGADPTATAPGALVRGGSVASGAFAGVFAVSGGAAPWGWIDTIGFRAAR